MSEMSEWSEKDWKHNLHKLQKTKEDEITYNKTGLQLDLANDWLRSQNSEHAIVIIELLKEMDSTIKNQNGKIKTLFQDGMDYAESYHRDKYNGY